MADYLPPVDIPKLSARLPLKADESTYQPSAAPPVADANVQIPLEDVTVPELADHVQQAIYERARLAAEATAAQDTWSRSSEKRIGETDQDHQARIKREFEAAVLAVRRQEDQPPMPPQPVPPAISEQTRREMEAGRKQSEYWRQQQKLRPLPTAKEIREAGTNTPVFRPGEYAHEKGGVDKNLVVQRG